MRSAILSAAALLGLLAIPSEVEATHFRGRVVFRQHFHHGGFGYSGFSGGYSAPFLAAPFYAAPLPFYVAPAPYYYAPPGYGYPAPAGYAAPQQQQQAPATPPVIIINVPK